MLLGAISIDYNEALLNVVMGSYQVSQAEDDEEKVEAEKKLLKTKELTPEVMEEWNAGIKEVVSGIFLRVCNNTVLINGTKYFLGLNISEK